MNQMIGPKEELAQFVWSQMTDRNNPELTVAVTDSLLALACHRIEQERPDLAAQMATPSPSVPTLRAVVALIWQEGFVAALSALEDGAISVVEEGTSPQGVN